MILLNSQYQLDALASPSAEFWIEPSHQPKSLIRATVYESVFAFHLCNGTWINGLWYLRLSCTLWFVIYSNGLTSSGLIATLQKRANLVPFCPLWFEQQSVKRREYASQYYIIIWFNDSWRPHPLSAIPWATRLLDLHIQEIIIDFMKATLSQETQLLLRISMSQMKEEHNIHYLWAFERYDSKRLRGVHRNSLRENSVRRPMPRTPCVTTCQTNHITTLLVIRSR